MAKEETKVTTIPTAYQQTAQLSAEEIAKETEANIGGYINNETNEFLTGSSSDAVLNDFNNLLVRFNDESATTQALFNDLYDEVRTSYDQQQIDGEAILNPARDTFQKEITRMSNSYNAKLSKDAERTDALIASGALGGNAYRAYQAHTQTNNDLMSQALGEISTVTMQATEYLTNAAIDIAKTNVAGYDSTMKTLASIAGMQADAALGYSTLMASTTVSAEGALQNLMRISLDSVTEQNKYRMQNRQLDAQIETTLLEIEARKEVANINNPASAFMRYNYANPQWNWSNNRGWTRNGTPRYGDAVRSDGSLKERSGTSLV